MKESLQRQLSRSSNIRDGYLISIQPQLFFEALSMKDPWSEADSGTRSPTGPSQASELHGDPGELYC